MFGWPRKSRSTSVLHVLEGTDDWVLWISVISSLHTFSGSRNPFFIFHGATLFGWLWKSRSTSGFAGAWGYWCLGLMDFRNFFITYVFGVKESIFHIPRSHPVWMTSENPGQLPVLHVFEGIDDQVLWFFKISSFSTFPGS